MVEAEEQSLEPLEGLVEAPVVQHSGEAVAAVVEVEVSPGVAVDPVAVVAAVVAEDAVAVEAGAVEEGGR